MITVPPEVIAGEALVCGVQAMLAVAWVYSRNDRMYGWQDTPSITARWLSEAWANLPDPTYGATFLFSRQDLAQDRVQALIRGRPLKAYFP